MECSAEREEVTPLASEIILTVSERRNRQKLTLSSTAAPFVFGRGRDCSFVLRRNNVGGTPVHNRIQKQCLADAGRRLHDLRHLVQ